MLRVICCDMTGRLTLNGVKGALLIVRCQVLDLLAHYERQLNLIVQVDALGPDDRALPRLQDTSWGLEEEERLLRPRAVQLLDVVPDERKCERACNFSTEGLQRGENSRIVAANADDLAGLGLERGHCRQPSAECVHLGQGYEQREVSQRIPGTSLSISLSPWCRQAYSGLPR